MSGYEHIDALEMNTGSTSEPFDVLVSGGIPMIRLHAVSWAGGGQGVAVSLPLNRIVPVMSQSATAEKPISTDPSPSIAYDKLRKALRRMRSLGEDEEFGITRDAAEAAEAMTYFLEGYRVPPPRMFSLDVDEVVFVLNGKRKRYLSGRMPQFFLRYYNEDGLLDAACEFNTSQRGDFDALISQIGGDVSVGSSQQHGTLPPEWDLSGIRPQRFVPISVRSRHLFNRTLSAA